jgi:putative serine protease PepD
MVRVSRQQGVPVITVDGQVVVGFNQPRLSELLGHGKASGSPQSRAKLGASIADAASQARKHPGLPPLGAYVGDVKPGTAAAHAGLREGDVITALGGQAVTSAADLHRLVPEMPGGRDVSLAYVRDGQKRETMVRL